MRLDSIKPNEGAKTKATRVGRGPGSGKGKTCGRGIKGQKSRSGGYHKVGFEGGQMPLQRRLPKMGFVAYKSLFAAEVRLSELSKLKTDVVSLETLKDANLIAKSVKQVKIFLSGDVKKPFTVQGIKVTKGAKQAIEQAGGTVESEA